MSRMHRVAQWTLPTTWSRIRAVRREGGICQRCGQEPAAPARSTCAPCLKAARKNYREAGKSETDTPGYFTSRYKVTKAAAIRHLATWRCDNPGCRVELETGKGARGKTMDHDHSAPPLTPQRYRATLCRCCNLAEGYLKTSRAARGLVQLMVAHEARGE